MSMKPIVALTVGNLVRPKRMLMNSTVKGWKYGKECDNLGGGLMPQAELRIVETSILPGRMWVRAQIPGRDPPAFLKISGEELGGNFDLV
jgi:hypothetical protein